MTPSPQRCTLCRHFTQDDADGGWCYAVPTPNGRRRLWISQPLYDYFIAFRGCSTFTELREYPDLCLAFREAEVRQAERKDGE